MEVKSTDKPNSTSSGDYGELRATSPVDSPPPPASDGDMWADEPGDTKMVGARSDSESHNSDY